MRSISRVVSVVVALFTFHAPSARSASPPESATASVALQWTAPGDDGMVGRATAYQIRYSIAPITEASFDGATPAVGTPAPGLPGATETFTVSGLVSNQLYFFAIKTLDEAGNRSGLSNVVAYPSPVTVVEDSPGTLSVSAPWPNPARNAMRCAVALPHGAWIEVDAFGVDGRLVRRLATGWHPAGPSEIAWDLCDAGGRRVPAGVYLVRARLGAGVWTRRVVVAR